VSRTYREDIRFLLGREERQIAGVDPHISVLEFLRLEEGKTGTKEGCAEGDCGACTVVIAERDGDGLTYKAVNSCIQFLPTLDGKQILTVEHLKEDGRLHDVQRAMAATHGSQCGFCTPGFVMSLYALYLNGGSQETSEINDVLAGNLCRCTGYGPIVQAAKDMGGRDRSSGNARDQERKIADQLTGLDDGTSLGFESERGRYFAPRSVDELADLYEQYPEAVILAGGTDVGLWVTKQNRHFETMIYLGAVEDLRHIEEKDGALHIGASVTYTEAHQHLTQHFADFGNIVRRIGGAQVRNAGTFGGNIANGSPIGDTPPVLIALDAKLILRQGKREREIPLEEFFIDYGKQDRAPGEFVSAIKIPLGAEHGELKAFKISKRFDQDISALLGAFRINVVGGKVERARIAYGGMAGTPKRATHCEAALSGKAWTTETIKAAQAALAKDFTPMSDLRAGANYRMQVAQNLLMKVFLEEDGGAVPLRLDGSGARRHG